MLDKVLENLFSKFNNNNIDYCIIRDFNDLSLINESEDIDLLIRSSDFLRADKLLRYLGWGTPKINPNAFGHVQYYKCEAKKIYKLDILKDLYYADGRYKLNLEKTTICYIQQNGIRIPTEEFALLFLVLHIVLDKTFVSEKNAVQLENLMKTVKNKDNWWWKIAKEIVERHDYQLLSKQKYIKEIEKNDCVEKIDNKIWCIKRRLIGRLWRMNIHKNSFAVIGVDGTGKSSTIEALKDYYGNDVFVQYMGFRSYITKIAKKWSTNKAPKVNLPGVNLIMQQVSCYYEMLCRYYLAKRSGRKLVLFDRYAWETYDNARNGYVKLFSWTLFKLLFPKPYRIVYLYCPTDVSLSRKDDIDDAEGFMKMKERIDSKYMKNRSALILDTSVDSKETVIDKVITYICVETQGYVK